MVKDTEIVMKSKRRTTLFLSIGIFLVVVLLVVWGVNRLNKAKKVANIEKITVSIGDVVSCTYGKNEFVVRDKNNIKIVNQLIEDYNDKDAVYEHWKVGDFAYNYNLKVEDKFGKQSDYYIQSTSISADNHMDQVFYSEEVVKQIGIFYLLDSSSLSELKITMRENMASSDVKEEKVTDSAVIKKKENE